MLSHIHHLAPDLQQLSALMQALIQFVARKLQGQQIANGHTPLGQAGRINLSLENLAIFLRVLQAHSLGSPPEIASEVNQLKHHALGTHPELQVLMVEAAAASSVPTPAASFPQDIEDEANAYFQKVFLQESSPSPIRHLLLLEKASGSDLELRAAVRGRRLRDSGHTDHEVEGHEGQQQPA